MEFIFTMGAQRSGRSHTGSSRHPTLWRGWENLAVRCPATDEEAAPLQLPSAPGSHLRLRNVYFDNHTTPTTRGTPYTHRKNSRVGRHTYHTSATTTSGRPTTSLPWIPCFCSNDVGCGRTRLEAETKITHDPLLRCGQRKKESSPGTRENGRPLCDTHKQISAYMRRVHAALQARGYLQPPLQLLGPHVTCTRGANALWLSKITRTQLKGPLAALAGRTLLEAKIWASKLPNTRMRRVRHRVGHQPAVGQS